MRILIAGNKDNGEFVANCEAFEKWADENRVRYVPEFLNTIIEPDTIGTYTDDNGIRYIDAGKFYIVQELTKKQIAHIASITNQICILAQNDSGYKLYYQNAKMQRIGRSVKVLSRGIFSLDTLSATDNASYSLYNNTYWIVA